MSTILSFLDAVIPAAETIYVFESNDPDGGVTVPRDKVEEASKKYLRPMISLADDSNLVEAVAGGAIKGVAASMEMRSFEQDFLAIYFLAEPVFADAVPEDFDIEVPLPGHEWGEDDTGGALYALDESGVLTLVETPEDEEEHADVSDVAAPVSVPEEPSAGREDEEDPAGDHADAGVDPGDGDVPAGGVEPGRAAQADDGAGGAAGDGAEAGGEDAPDGAESGAAPERLNDAIVLGDDCPEFEAAMTAEATFLFGKVWPDKPHKSTQDGEWHSHKASMASMILGHAGTPNAPAFGLSRHPVGKQKDGPCMVLGSSIGGSRKANAMDTMYAIGLDIDSGASLDYVRDRILKLGFAASLYTSWSHGKQGMSLKRDDVLKKLEIKADPTEEQVRDYLRHHGKNRFEESFIQKVTISDAKKQEKDGVKIILDTPPIDKFRVIFFLDAPVKLIDLAETQAEALSIWEDTITGLAQKVLGVHFDTSCTDPSRLFFTSRHDKSSKDWQCYLLKGKPLTFAEIPRMKKSQYTRNRDLNPFVEADDASGAAAVPNVYLPSGGSLNEWHSKYGKSRFQIADLLEAHCPERIRVSGGEKAGSVHTECPFEHQHSKEGGTATMAINALDNTNGYWTWFCHHDACQDRHKLEFLGEAINQGWFDESLLFDDAFLLPPEDDPEDEEIAAQEQAEMEASKSSSDSSEETKPTDPVSLAERIDETSTEADIRKLFKRLMRRGIDAVERGKVMEIVARKSPLGKRELTKMWRALEKEAAQKQQEAEGGSLIPKVNETDFRDLCEYGIRRIRKANEEQKRVFHYMEGLYVIRDDSYGNARMKALDERGFSHLLNTVAVFERSMGDNHTIGVAAPREVVTFLFNDDFSTYPSLRGLITSPSFSASGNLISEEGYHAESGLYYQPNQKLVVPPVSDAPTATEVHEAKRLLIEEVFADFPLGQRTRPEIVKAALDEDGETIPALANLMALVLLPFMREMVNGPTPGHLLNKPAPGTGASLLTDMVSMIATGQVSPAMSMPPNNDEMAKTLTSVLANGKNIVFFDNINHSVDSGELASAMTAPTYSARILGTSQTVETEVRCVWIFTGNNVTLSNELVRRLVMIDLDARLANPEMREDFRHANLRDFVEENRGLLVWACLTLIRNWIAQGKPQQNTNVLASYENWSRVIGGVLDCAGIKGFMGNRAMLKEQAEDDDDDELQNLIEVWWQECGTQSIPVRASDERSVSIQNLCAGHEIAMPLRVDKTADDAFTFNAKALGKFMGKYRGRIFELEGGQSVSLQSDAKRSRGGKLWHLEQVGKTVVKGNV